MAKQKWTFKGRLMLNHLLPEISKKFGTTSPLAGVKIKLLVRSRIPFGFGSWKSWGKTKTDSSGRFSFTKEKGSDRRQFRLKILFDNKDLRIKAGGSFSTEDILNNGVKINSIDITNKDWFEILNDKKSGKQRKAGVINVGNLLLSSGRVQRLGAIWDLYQRAIKAFDSFGSKFSLKKVIIKFPMNIGSISYANPANHHIYISKRFDNGHKFPKATNVLLHELMHVWAYHHSKGELGLAHQLLKHKTVHQKRENTTFVPFHEGFAEWGASKLIKQITGKNSKMIEASFSQHPHLPLSRAHISEPFEMSECNIENMDYAERGWYSLFNILTYRGLGKCNFNEKGKFVSTNVSGVFPNMVIGLTFKEVLSIFLKHPKHGYNNFLEKGEMDFDSFLNRAKDIIDDINDSRIKEVLTYLDPKKTENPADLA